MTDQAKTITKQTFVFAAGLYGSDVFLDIYSSSFIGKNQIKLLP